MDDSGINEEMGRFRALVRVVKELPDLCTIPGVLIKKLKSNKVLKETYLPRN